MPSTSLPRRSRRRVSSASSCSVSARVRWPRIRELGPVVGPAPQAGITLGPGLLCGTGTFYGVPATVIDAMGFPGSVSFSLPASTIGLGFVAQGISLESGLCLRLTDPLAVTIHAP